MKDEKLHIKKEVINKLEELTKEEGYLYSLCFIILQNLFSDPEKIADINWREQLNSQEITFLVGLVVKNKINDTIIPDEERVNNHIVRTSEFFQELHFAHVQPFPKIMSDDKGSLTEKEKAAKDFFGSGAFMTEPIFYGPNGAYDFQYWEFAPIKYKLDSIWIQENKGISMTEMVNISKTIKNNIQEKWEKLRQAEDFSDLCRKLLMLCSFTLEDLGLFDKNVVEKFIEAFSVMPGNVNQNFDSVGAYNAAESHPIIILSNNLYFLPVMYNLAQSIYESPFYWMVNDEKYKDIASKNRGNATENVAFNLLRNIFGKENVFKNVKVSQKNGDDITDIDVLAVAGNKAVIIQAKSKKLTELSKRGNDEKLRKDFKDAVQNAYDQGIICRTSLITKTNKLTTEDGNKLVLQELVEDAYIIFLTTDHYPAVIQQTEFYLERKSEDPFPLTMNICEFDILTFYLKDPFEFLYYLRQRISLYNYFRADNEVTFLAYHFKYKLFPREGDGDMVALDSSIAQLIDANFPVLRGYQPKTKAAEKLYPKWKNPKFDRLVSQAKVSRLGGLTDLVFFLYDLAGERVDDIIYQIEIAKKKTIIDNKMHDFSMSFDNGKSGLTFLSYLGIREKMVYILMQLAKARKYKTRADVWIGIGSIPKSPNIADIMVFNKEPWVEDSRLNELVKVALKEGIPLNLNGKKSGRNDPCPCGSGKKYKNCHGK